MISLPPGRKIKAGCPEDLHLKLPEEIRALIDNLGPGDYHSKIIGLLLKNDPNRFKKSSFELQVIAVKLGKDIRRLSEEKAGIMEQLKEGQSIEDYDRIISRIHNEVYPEDS